MCVRILRQGPYVIIFETRGGQPLGVDREGRLTAGLFLSVVLIRKAPEQYLWMHKRFKTRPPGEARFY